MSKGGKVKKTPKYKGVTKSADLLSKRALEMGKQAFDIAVKAYESNADIVSATTDEFLQTMTEQFDAARGDRQSYEGTFKPLEEDLAREATDYASEGRKNYEAGRAAAGVQEEFNAAREASIRQLEGFGIDPSSTRLAALDLDFRLDAAAKSAVAQENARKQVEDTGRALRSEAIQVGQKTADRAITGAQSAANIGSQAVDANLNLTGTGMNAINGTSSFINAGAGAINSGTAARDSEYSNRIAEYKAEQEAKASSGIGAILGTAVGIGSKVANFAEGGRIDETLSPTAGIRKDDAVIKATAGEFVVPKDVVLWEGEKHFHSMINKAREGRQKAIAA